MRIWSFALGIAAGCAMLAPASWAYRQQVVICPQQAGFRVLDLGLNPRAEHVGCEPFDAQALRQKARQGERVALEKLLAVMEQTRILPVARVRAAKALDWPNDRALPKALLMRLEELFAARKTPFRAAVAIGGFLSRFESSLPAAPRVLWPGLQWRLLKEETCPLAAELLSHAGSEESRRLMIRAWMDGQKSDGVTSCIEREIGPHASEMVEILQQAALKARDPVVRMRLINWLALAGDKARPAMAAFVDDPDPRVRRLAEGYLQKKP